MPSRDSPKILIVAAEASSCLYARRLLEHWQSQEFKVEAFGIGDSAMADAGFEILARAEDLAVVGLQEVLAHWSVIKQAFHKLLVAAETRRPDVVLLLDYPGFNLRLAKKLKAMGIKVVYYISPQVWAWRTGRVNLIRRIVDRMLVVLPFEVPFYQTHDVNVDFVGHPLLDELKPGLLDIKFQSIRRAKYGIGESDLVLALMPGSRNSELKHHLATQLETARRLYKEFPKLKVVLLVAPNFSKQQLVSQLGELEFPLIIVKDEPFQMIALADVVLVASGTATLMVGLMQKPMVVMYKMNSITAWLAKKFVRHTRYFALINLVLDELVVTELFQGDANPEKLSRELGVLLQSSSARRVLAEKLAIARSRLGHSGATKRVADILNSFFNGATS